MHTRVRHARGHNPRRTWLLAGIIVVVLVWAAGPVHAASSVLTPAQQTSSTATPTTTTTETPTTTTVTTQTPETTTPTPVATATETATATPTPLPPGQGRSNIVKVVNQTNNRLRADGKVQINHISASNVSPTNEAYASSTCTDCQTFAVALQINLIGTNATLIHPQNIAVAINDHCTRCDTAAWAYQYNLSVSDPDKIPSNVRRLVAAMNSELGTLRHKSTSVAEAKAAINAVILQFRTLAQHLRAGQVETTKDKDKRKKQQH